MKISSGTKRYIIAYLIILIIVLIIDLDTHIQHKKKVEYTNKSEFYKLMREEKIDSWDWIVSAESELLCLDSLIKYYKGLDKNLLGKDAKFSTFCFFLGEQKAFIEKECKAYKLKLYSKIFSGTEIPEDEDQLDLFEQNNSDKISKLKANGHIFTEKTINYTRAYEKFINNEEEYRQFCKNLETDF